MLWFLACLGPGRIQEISLLDDVPRIVILQKDIPSSLVLFLGWSESGACPLCFLLSSGGSCSHFLGKDTCVSTLHHLKVAWRKRELTFRRSRYLLFLVTPWCSRKCHVQSPFDDGDLLCPQLIISVLLWSLSMGWNCQLPKKRNGQGKIMVLFHRFLLWDTFHHGPKDRRTFSVSWHLLTAIKTSPEPKELKSLGYFFKKRRGLSK